MSESAGSAPQPINKPHNDAAFKIAPDLVQQLLDHDYLKLKLMNEVDKLVEQKVARWRKMTLTIGSALAVILGTAGFHANNVLQQLEARLTEANSKVSQVQTEVDAAADRAKKDADAAKENVQQSMRVITSSQDLLTKNFEQLDKVREMNKQFDKNETKFDHKMNQIDAKLGDIDKTRDKITDSYEKFKPFLDDVPKAVGAITEARRAGTLEIIFLENHSARTIVIDDYEHASRKYRVKFFAPRIKDAVNLDVQAAELNGLEFPVQHFTNLSAGESHAIKNTSLYVEISALRHHRQPFLHSFVILRVFAKAKSDPSAPEEAPRIRTTEAVR